MWYHCRVCGFQQMYMTHVLKPKRCRGCGREGTMEEGAKRGGFQFYDVMDRFEPVDVDVDDSVDIETDKAAKTGKLVALGELDIARSGTHGKKYIQLLQETTTYIDAFNNYMLPDPDAFAWLVPYTGNHHNRTFFTHLVISAVARQIAMKFRRLPTLIEPFVGTGQIFLISLSTVDLFNAGQSLFCGMIGGDLNHYLIAAYNVMLTEAGFVKDYTDFAAKLDRQVKQSFDDSLMWLDQNGEASALGKVSAARLEAVCRYIYVVNRCKRGSSLNISGGVSATRNSGLELKGVRERERKTLTNLTVRLSKFPCALECRDFQVTCANARPGDLVVMDAPFPQFTYFDTASTNNSSTYGTGSSGDDLQIRITRTAQQLTAAGVTVLLCNYANPSLLRDYASIGAHVIFTYKRPTTKSEVYQLAIIPGIIHGKPIFMGPALEVIKSTWLNVAKCPLVIAPRFELFEKGLREFFALFKKQVVFKKRNPGKRNDLPGVIQGTVSQFWVPGGEVACSPMATLAISYLLGLNNAGQVTADAIDNILLEGTLLYQRMANSARIEQIMMRLQAMLVGKSMEPGVAPGDAPYFNPLDIPDDEIAARNLIVVKNVSASHAEVPSILEDIIRSAGLKLGCAIVMGGYTVSIVRMKQRIFLFDSHGWGEHVGSAFVYERDMSELGEVLVLLGQMLEARVPKSSSAESSPGKPLSSRGEVLDVNLTFFKST